MPENEGDLLIKRAVEIIERDPPHWRKFVRANVLQHWACIMAGFTLSWLIHPNVTVGLSMAAGATVALIFVRFSPPPITTHYRRRQT